MRTMCRACMKCRTFYFPVIFNGKIKLILSVDKYKNSDRYAIGSLGYEWLAKELNAIYKKWPGEKGFTPVLYRNPQTRYFSFNIPQKDAANLTIIHAGFSEMRGAYSVLSSLNDAMNEYRELLSKILPSGGEE